MTDRGWWNKPVPVRIGGTIYNVSNTLQAANMLLDGWPDAEGAIAMAARRACLSALEGGDKQEARDAFEAAAKAAGILVPVLN